MINLAFSIRMKNHHRETKETQKLTTFAYAKLILIDACRLLPELIFLEGFGVDIFDFIKMGISRFLGSLNPCLAKENFKIQNAR